MSERKYCANSRSGEGKDVNIGEDHRVCNFTDDSCVGNAPKFLPFGVYLTIAQKCPLYSPVQFSDKFTEQLAREKEIVDSCESKRG